MSRREGIASLAATLVLSPNIHFQSLTQGKAMNTQHFSLRTAPYKFCKSIFADLDVLKRSGNGLKKQPIEKGQVDTAIQDVGYESTLATIRLEVKGGQCVKSP